MLILSCVNVDSGKIVNRISVKNFIFSELISLWGILRICPVPKELSVTLKDSPICFFTVMSLLYHENLSIYYNYRVLLYFLGMF